jgi:hypothetical protein
MSVLTLWSGLKMVAVAGACSSIKQRYSQHQQQVARSKPVCNN